MKRTDYLLLTALAAALVLLFVLFGHEQVHPLPTYVSDTSNIRFELATTTAEQELGLGSRADIPHDYGMLFVFHEDADYGFWMKGMLTPIDIIWLSDNGTILSILDSVATSTYPQIFYPPEPVRYVLEMRAGEARAQGWAPGTTLRLP